MFRKFTYLLLLVICGIGIAFGLRAGAKNSVLGVSEEAVPTVSVFKEIIKPVYEAPRKIKISAQSVDAEIIEVGVAADGSLGTPADWFKAGWYADSARAGEVGNLIIDGHYDTNTGAPASFWALKNVKTGDIVTLFDEYGRAYHYQVSEVFYLNINDPARLQIFESKNDGAYITLVTCGGIWLPGNHTYSQRLIVKGKLVD